MTRRVEKADFAELADLAMSSTESARMRPVIQKELLHYDILYILDSEGLLDQLTFQGGTLLRLCHAAPRYSEDLDFVGGKDFDRQQLEPLKHCIEHYIGQRYDLNVSVSEPSDLKHDRENDNLKIEKWQISVTTDPGKRHIPQQRIKIEIANVDACTREARAVRLHYDSLPEGYGDTLVLSETLDEVMADKLVSLVNTTGYVRNRDIWDLHWLKRKGIEVRVEWVLQKICDYRIDDYQQKLGRMLKRLPEIIEGKVFQRELERFIPMDVTQRTLDKPKFRKYLISEMSEMLEQLQTD